jgi:hypothetical protein
LELTGIETAASSGSRGCDLLPSATVHDGYWKPQYPNTRVTFRPSANCDLIRLRKRVGQQFKFRAIDSYMSARDITKMPNACASVLNGVNSGEAMEKCETGHFPCSNASGLSILDYREVNPLTSIDLSHPHRESRSVLKSLPFLDFDSVWHPDLTVIKVCLESQC